MANLLGNIFKKPLTFEINENSDFKSSASSANSETNGFSDCGEKF